MSHPPHTRMDNVPFDQLEIGMEASDERTCRADDLYVFANASGNLNPMHLPKEDGDGDGVPEAVAPGMWVASLISSVLGCKLPGPGTLYHAQTLRFLGRAHAGDTLTARVRLTRKGPGHRVTFDTWVENAAGERIVDGEAEVDAPAKPLHFEADDIPGLTVQRHAHFDRLLAQWPSLTGSRTNLGCWRRYSTKRYCATVSPLSVCGDRSRSSR